MTDDLVKRLRKEAMDAFGDGMTLRDWFAAQALMCLPRQDGSDMVRSDPCNAARFYARHAYILADAMLEVRATLAAIKETPHD